MTKIRFPPSLLIRLFIFCPLFAILLTGCPARKASTHGKEDTPPAPLLCHVGGTMRPAIEALAAEYGKASGQKIEVNSAGSGELLAHIELQKEGDVYVCHDPFLDILMAKGLGADAWTIAELTPVLVVRKGNPKKLTGLRDFERKDVEIVLPERTQSTLGYLLPTIFSKAGVDFERLQKEKTIPTNRSGSYVANMVATGNADAGIVWNAVAHLRRTELDVIRIDAVLPVPNVDAITSATSKSYYLTPVKVTVATLRCTKRPAAAKAFAEFLASPKASKILEEFDYTLNPAITGKCRNAR